MNYFKIFLFLLTLSFTGCTVSVKGQQKPNMIYVNDIDYLTECPKLHFKPLPPKPRDIQSKVKAINPNNQRALDKVLIDHIKQQNEYIEQLRKLYTDTKQRHDHECQRYQKFLEYNQE